MISQTDILKKMKKPVGVLGYGVTGKAICEFLESQKVSTKIYAEDSNQFFLEDRSLREHDLFIISPGFPLDHIWIKKIKTAKVTFLGELDFASLFWKGRLVAITGTNGKTTITTFINHVLQNSGYHSYAVGNIGTPFCKILNRAGKDSSAYAICEVSSFQAEQLRQFFPDYVIWTNFTCDHLDRHKTIENYFSTKLRLLEKAQKKAFIGKDVADFIASIGRILPEFCQIINQLSHKVPIPLKSPFAYAPQEENYRIAHRLLVELGIPEKTIKKTISQFKLPPHRLKKIMEWKGINFWNDSKSTNWGATMGALSRFSRPVHWIGGGSSKGENPEKLLLGLEKKIKYAYLIGEVADSLSIACKTCKISAQKYLGLENAFKACMENAVSGDNILFSPGFASFDQFKSYVHRGNYFEKLVLGLKKENSEVNN